jgi:hypothetical protein
MEQSGRIQVLAGWLFVKEFLVFWYSGFWRKEEMSTHFEKGKSKGEVHPRTGHEGPERE